MYKCLQAFVMLDFTFLFYSKSCTWHDCIWDLHMGALVELDIKAHSARR